MARQCIGIDLGGTAIKFGLLDEDNQFSETIQRPTPTDRGGDGVVEQMVSGARELLEQAKAGGDEIVGVGIGAPGPLRISEGVIVAMPNIAGMENVQLRDRVGEGLNLPAVLENDANAAALGEFLIGAGRAAQNMVLLTLGTGLGSGIIIEGEILHGAHEMGAEIGHMIVQPGGEQCGCGQQGCLERYCSAKYLAHRAARRIRDENITGPLAGKLREKGEIDSLDIERAMEAGDDFAAEMWDEAVYYLAVGCVNICRIFDPDEIVLGGGLTGAGEVLTGPLQKHFERLHWSMAPVTTKIALARLGNDAGVVGAAGVAWRAFGR
ncbi:MAG: ROK family protein [Phycisphaerae bacterium]